MSTRTPARAGGNPRRGLRGSLDLQVDTITDSGHVEMGGWAFHANAEVLLVVVTADGRVVGTAHRDVLRPDVAAAHGTAAQCGWSLVADIGWTGDVVLLQAHALVRVPASGDEKGRTLLLPFAERELPVAGGGRARGAIDVPLEVAPGVLHVGGTADIRPALARVEVSLGHSPGSPARTSLPSTGDETGAESLARGFSAYVDVPEGVSEVTVNAIVTATDGSRAALPSRTVQVVPAPGAATTAERQRVRDARLQQHIAVLRASVAPGRRVLVAAHDLHVGGAQNYLDELMRGLHDAGIEMCVVAGSGGPLLDRIESDLGAPVLVVGPPPLDGEQLATRVRLVADFALEHGAAACVANTLVTFPAVLAARAVDIPTTWAVHESFAPEVFWHEYLGRAADPELVARTLEALAGCEDVVFEATTTRDLYTDIVPAEAASFVPYGVDTAALDRELASTGREQARAELGIAPDERVLVCVGTVEPRKGQLALARAFARIEPERRRGAALYLVGAGDTAYARALRDFVARGDLTSVHVVDIDPDITRWYVAADVLVSASDVESMPRTMIEAMLVGRPVAGVDAFGVGELVQDGISGWLCPPRDLVRLTEILRRAVVTGGSGLDAMGAAARERVLQRHDSAGYIAHVTDRLRGWLSETPSATPSDETEPG
nr:glycosyltransferase family 4 protein [uncultured Nocardioides sp.]